MKSIKRIIRMMSLGAIVIAGASCSQAEKKTEEAGFRYLIDEFADLKVMRYRIPGWEELSLRQKEYVYHLAEAAKWGRDIYFEQNCEGNLRLRKVIEKIINEYAGDRTTADYLSFEVYAKRVFFSNGVHHHYAEDKFFPECSKEYFASLMESVGAFDQGILDFVYDRETGQQRRSTSQEGDIVTLSAVNYYEGVTRKEVEDYYASIEDKNDPRPIAYGLNTKVVKQDGKVTELPWCVGGLYSDLITKICDELEKAAAVAENDTQRKCISLLVDYYRTGDLRKWDEYNVAWVGELEGTVDFVNGFVEDYNDPLGRKGAWEGNVNIKDHKASERTEILSANAQWFEDNSPVDPRFRKPEVKGVSAKVINVACISGDSYPSTPIGINLPNADWIRKEYGSKSVTIANITHAYDQAANESPNNMLDEFAWDDAEKELIRKWGSYADEIHTDLHECLGHGSGQLLPGVATTAMGEYSSTLEETRADLFGLYYSADPKLVELGIMPDAEAYKAEYSSYIRNGLFTQFTRVELGAKNTEAHMQNRKLIAQWCYEKGLKDNVIEKKTRDGKTYFVINDYPALRNLFAELLAEIQRIKSEGDYEAGKNLVETYAVNIDPQLHKEVLERYAKLNLKPYGGFVNPDIVPVVKDGKVVDYTLEYTDSFLDQQLKYGRDYSL
ncbi:MAG: dihydrofolate reductase [Bacteroidales bacterium]|uniref:dipeptidyl-peptidase 3 family protein n=1 Tax=Candidatus Cryptobacteroides sp. TaxID=2952915 RepID=UPI002A758592|nr:dihydrofolate reductase [Candidatus Cryptobacteroides sp.]MDD7235283.1 dihydrofolate reductase [Bacteroidales bacterium]MDY2702393.1 dihydrofolate reductase [Candidatus Cryptobacteroides sp.]